MDDGYEYEDVGRHLFDGALVYFMKDGERESGTLIAKKGNDAKILFSNGTTTIVDYRELFTNSNPDYDQEVEDFGQIGGRRKKTKKNKKSKRKSRKH